MEFSLLLSMAGFALAMSISPGPVNLVALGTGARYGFTASLRHVVGATLGFILLLLLMGLGLGGAHHVAQAGRENVPGAGAKGDQIDRPRGDGHGQGKPGHG
jgi:threonine/homoserine/homoserine lactone efflux protein